MNQESKTTYNIINNKKCYLCDKNEANSKEHIIPNAIGGKLKAKILCKCCNSALGEKYDSKLAESLLLFSNWTSHSRDNGEIPSFESNIFIDGKEVKAKRDSKTGIFSTIERNHTSDKNGLKLNYIALGDGIKQVKKEGKIALSSFGEKNALSKERIDKQIDKFEKIIDDSEKVIEQPLVRINSSMVGNDVFLSCLKTAINFHITNNLDRNHIIDSIKTLRDTPNNISKICNFYPYEVPQNDGIFHTLYLKGDKENKKLFCIISYFSVFQVFVILNDNYLGEELEKSYCYDIWNGKENLYNHRINLTKENIDFIFKNDSDVNKKQCSTYKKNLKRFLNHFRIDNTIDLKQVTEIATDFLFEALYEFLKSNLTYYSKNEFQKVFSNKVFSMARPTTLKRLKDEDINIVIDSNIDVLFTEYQKKFTGMLMTPSISTLITKTIIDKSQKKGFLTKEEWGDIKLKVIELSKEIKTPHEELDIYISDCVIFILEHLTLPILKQSAQATSLNRYNNTKGHKIIE